MDTQTPHDHHTATTSPLQKRRKNRVSPIRLNFDSQLKQHIKKVLGEKGVTITEAIEQFLLQIVLQSDVPYYGFVNPGDMLRKDPNFTGNPADYDLSYVAYLKSKK